MPRFALHKRVATVGACLLALGFLLSGGRASAFTAAGVAIENQATLTFLDAPSGLLVEVRSNTSRVLVSRVRRMDFGPPGALVRLPGERVDFAHRLSNQGNAADRFLIDSIALQGELVSPRLVHDVDGNGLADAGEPQIDGFMDLEAGESIDLVFAGSLPSTANSAETVVVSLTAMAEAASGSASEPGSDVIEAPTPVSVRDTVDVSTPALPLLALVSAPECSVLLQPGDVVALAMSVSPADNELPLEREVLVSGVPERGVLVELPLPDGVMPATGVKFTSNAVGSQMLTRGEDGNWVEFDSTVHALAATVAWLWPVDALTHSESVRFSLPLQIVTENHPERVQLHAVIDVDGDGQINVDARDSCEHQVGSSVDEQEPPVEEETPSVEEEIPPVVATTGTIRFVLPAVTLRREGQAPSFANDAHYVDTGFYELAPGRLGALESAGRLNSDISQYEPSRDGIYIEFRGQAGDDLVQRSPNGVEHMPVRVSSSAVGVETTVWLRETAPDSGVYRSLVPLSLRVGATTTGDCLTDSEQAFAHSTGAAGVGLSCEFASDYSDILVVTVDVAEDGVNELASNSVAEPIMDIAVTDPASVAFDSSTGASLANVHVTVMERGVPAQHPATGAALVYTTDARGRFGLPRLAPDSRYSIEVIAPDGYRFPSAVSPEELTGRFSDRRVVAASYGARGPEDDLDGALTLAPDAATPVIDVPLDPVRPAAAIEQSLLLEKTVEQEVVEIGEAIGYTLILENTGAQELDELSVIDTPPEGFVYIANSSRRDGQSIDDPLEQRGTRTADNTLDTDEETASDQGVDSDRLTLHYRIGSMEPGERIEISYALQAGAQAGVQAYANARDGTVLNTAVASAATLLGDVVATAPASARVRLIRSGAFGERGMIFGKVYIDATCDGIQNRREWPIPGVRLYLQDGRFAVTDEDGLYTLADVPAALHVLKVDETTLPEGLVLKPLSTRNAADPGSRFIPLIEGEWHRADVASYCPQDRAGEVLAELHERHDDLSASWILDEASRFDPNNRQPLATDISQVDSDGDLGSGWRGPDAGRAAQREAPAVKEPASNNAVAPVSEEVLGMGDPQTMAAGITRAQGEAGTFLWPTDGISDDGRFMVVVRGGIEPTLYVNDAAVPGTQIGERIENRRESAQIVAWYGVALEPGASQVEVRGRDAFGNERVLAATEVRRPAQAARLLLRAPDDELPADGGRSRLPIDILITDADGTPASGVRFVTLETTRGAFDGEDLQSREPGHQVRIEKGRAKVYLKSSEQAGRLRVTARSSGLRANLNLVQLTAPRPLIATGLLELGASRATHGDDVDSARIETDSRAAVFIKGGVGGGAELTLAWDSDPPADTELLEALPTDAPYPLTGDASLQGFEAQSRSALYARLERDRNSVMWGDYLTDSQSDLDDLARTQRTLTGLNGVYDTGRTRVQAFAAEQSDTRRVEIIAGNGTALLFSLQGTPVVPNSEVLERIVRSHDNTGLVIASERLVAGVDYRLDPVTGFLRFADVIPSTTEDGDPIFIRASYDTEGDGEEHLIAGLRLSQRVGASTFLGASFTEDQNPESGFQIAGAQLRYVLGGASDPLLSTGAPGTELSVSGALMRHQDEREGQAARVGLSHAWGGRADTVTRLSWARATIDFDNPGSGVAAGRTEWRLEHRHPFGKKTRLLIDALESSASNDLSRYRSVGFRVERDVGAWTLALGTRRINSLSPAESLTFTTGLVSAARTFTFSNARAGRLGVEYEQAIDDPERNRLAVEARIGISEHVDLYARYERQQGVTASSLSGLGSDTEQLVAGVSSDLLPATELFSEYRLRGAFDGRDMETASGVRGRYQLEPGLNVSPSLEVIRSLRGEGTDAVAVSLGVSDTRHEHRRMSAQAEYRRTQADEYIGLRASVAQRLSRDWTMVATEEFTRLFPQTGQTTIRQRLSFGAARRPKHDNRHHALWLLEWKYDRTPAFDGDTDRFVLSTHQNRELGKHATLSGRLAGKWQRLMLGEQTTWQRASLASSRISVEIARRWEVDIGAGVLATGEGRGLGADDLAWSAGAGLSWVAMHNLALTARWNAIGFSDPDLDSAGLNEAGWRIGMQYKFDEEAFRWLNE